MALNGSMLAATASVFVPYDVLHIDRCVSAPQHCLVCLSCAVWLKSCSLKQDLCVCIFCISSWMSLKIRPGSCRGLWMSRWSRRRTCRCSWNTYSRGKICVNLFAPGVLHLCLISCYDTNSVTICWSRLDWNVMADGGATFMTHIVRNIYI